MADIHESRDAAKKRLRSGVIDGSAGEGSKKPSLLVYIAALTVALAVVISLYITVSRSASDIYTVDFEISEEGLLAASDTMRGYISFAGGIIKYTKDGARYLDKNGSFVWDRSYQMSAPIADASSDYAVIADRGATRMYIFDASSLTGALDTLLPISKVRISEGGVVFAVLNDSDAAYITAFDKDGTALDLSVKSILSGDGYPFDIDISPDATELITSYISVSDGELRENVVFRNFSSIGANEDARRVVGGFSDEFEGHIVGRVNFSTNELSQAFYDGGVVFFSTKVLNSPEVIANQTIPGEIMMISSGSELSAVLSRQLADEETGEQRAPYTLTVFTNKSGSVKTSADVDSLPDSMLINADTAVLAYQDRILVYRANGTLRADLSFDEGESIDSVVSTGSAGELLIAAGSSIYKISF